MMPMLTTESLVALVTLTVMEIVLGIDNIIFVAILVGRLPATQQDRARRLGIFLALFMRLGLLFSLTWIMGLTEPFFEIAGRGVSGRDLILLLGGMFLIYKATKEIHGKLEGEEHHVDAAGGARRATFGATIGQIVLLDIVFSLDSVITAVGMAQAIWIMVAAMVLAVGVMLVASGGISRFVERHPTIKMLALSFLLLIGVTLLVEGMGGHVNKGYIYFAMAFSFGVELLNLKLRKKSAPRPVHLRDQRP